MRDHNVRFVVWPDYASADELRRFLVEYKPLLKADAISLFFHHDATVDPPDARERLEETWRSTEIGELSTLAAWGDARSWEGPAPSAWAALPSSTTSERMSLREALALPTVSNRYDAEEICVAQGVLEGSIKRAFCPLPWWHLHLEADGIATPCCVAHSVTDGPSLADSPLSAVYNNVAMRRVRLNMLRGVRDAACRDCWDWEELDANSFRRRALTSQTSWDDPPGNDLEELATAARAMTLDDGTIPEEKIAPRSIDIRWSNLCNFKCRMCYHRSSSAWFDDAQRMADELEKLERSGNGSDEAKNARRSLVWGDKAVVSFNGGGDALSKIAPHLHALRNIYSAGGEPLMMQEHFDLLKSLGPRSGGVTLGYNTNLSRLDYRGHDLIEIWSAFKSVLVRVSCDGIGPVGEYVRTGFQTDRFLANLKRIRDAANRDARLTYLVAITISNYNVFHIPELVRKVMADGLVDGPDNIQLLVVRTPIYASPSVLPRHVRERAADEYQVLLDDFDRDFPSQRATRPANASVIAALRGADDALFAIHREEASFWLDRLDRLRSTDWRDVIPHMDCFEHDQP